MGMVRECDSLELFNVLEKSPIRKKEREEKKEEFGCTDGRTVWEEYLFFSVLNRTWARRIQDQDNYNVSVLFQRGGRDRTYVGRHGILALRMTVTQ